jgi:UDP-N-acetyl-2-amino-2-deoxyglucuronate dehydrogenase
MEAVPVQQSPPKRFALIGVAGFVARRHLESIAHVGGRIVAALDVRDSVGVLDQFSPDARFFVDPAAFFDHLGTREGRVDYVSVCSPNHLHEEHCREACLRGADVICEKPLVLGPQGLGRLRALEVETGRRIHPVLQLRLHPEVLRLKQSIDSGSLGSPGGILDVDVTYITRRGPWYAVSWKGNPSLSGGILFNLGIHFFDVLTWFFGAPEAGAEAVGPDTIVGSDRASGSLRFPRARVRWMVSTRQEDLPSQAEGRHAYRTITVNNRATADCSGDYAFLHRIVYKKVLAGLGQTVEDARTAIELVARIDREVVARAGGDRRAIPTAPAVHDE